MRIPPQLCIHIVTFSLRAACASRQAAYVQLGDDALGDAHAGGKLRHVSRARSMAHAIRSAQVEQAASACVMNHEHVAEFTKSLAGVLM